MVHHTAAMNRIIYSLGFVLLTIFSVLGKPTANAINAPEGWQTAAPREELRPRFSYIPKGGEDRTGAFVIQSDEREGLHGYWTKRFEVKGGSYYAFRALRRIQNVESPRRSVVARVVWQDAKGNSVPTEETVVKDVLQGMRPMAEPEYPSEGKTDRKGWTEMAAVYRAPAKAARAVVELHLQWASKGKVEWSRRGA